MADSTTPTPNTNSTSTGTDTNTSTSTSTPAVDPPVITLHIPPSLQKYAVPASTHLSTLGSGPSIPSILAASGIIIIPSSPSTSTSSAPTPSQSQSQSQPRLQTNREPKTLLIKRAPGGGLASRWEPPGGGIEDSDPTILHGVAREVFEETGLRVCRFRALVGGGARTGTVPHTFAATSRGRVYLKLNFLVEVVEGGALGSGWGVGDGEDGEDGEVKVRLDPEEHTEWRWVAEEELDGFEVTSPSQMVALKHAFEVYREQCGG